MRLRLVLLALSTSLLALAGCGEDGRRAELVPPPGDATAASGSPSEWTLLPPDFEPLPGAKAHFGFLDRASFRIEMPSNWNGSLLLWAHGHRGYGLEVRAESPPPALREALIEGGFAWAASSYSQNGYAAGVGAEETLALKRYFAERFRAPAKTYIAGESMGGHVTVLSLERFPEEYDGGLSLCGVVAGQEWTDYLIAWALAAEYLAGAQLPLEEGKSAVTEALQASVLPVLGPPESPTLRGQAFASVIRNLTGGPRPFFQEGFEEVYLLNFGLITGDPGRKMPITQAASTLDIDYQPDPDLGFDGDVMNREVRRFAGDPALRDPASHADTAPTTGQLQDPLLTLHETGDLTVPISMEQSYRRKVDAAGSGEFLSQRAIRNAGHCEFSDSELVAGWDALVSWAGGGLKPAGDDLSSDPSDIGRAFTTPARPGDGGP